MSAVDPAIISETHGGTDGDCSSRSSAAKRGRRLVQPSIYKPAAKITKNKQTNKAPARGSVRHFPCRQCVTLATKAPGHECASQDKGGAACWDCAKNGYTCRPVPVEAHAAVRAFWTFNRLRGADNIPDEAWRAAAQWAAQKLRACGSGEVAPATPRPAPDLASFSEVAERSLEERKVIALETIAGVVQLWFQLDQPDEEEEGEEKENGDN